MTYEERSYRDTIKANYKLEIGFQESDLLICSKEEIDQESAKKVLVNCYEVIENYAKSNPEFLTSLSPLRENKNAAVIIQKMLAASRIANIGPFASVAGAIAEETGLRLSLFSQEIIIENGGDIFLKINEDKIIGVYAGRCFEPEVIKLKIKSRDCSFGLASSSAHIGHSLNFGRADLVTVLSSGATVADALATSLSNQIKQRKDIKEVFSCITTNPFVEGLLIIFEGEIFLWGNLELA
ncbi:MAG: UPF0280 family protein [Candidatus Omnitrophica bacterium]|nr:UPF0280 family protein [Candidatus Omnitrophota bacterium]MDD5429479.1 UPF0280 family protein [Candidatus Omnitrophota bacterium]